MKRHQTAILMVSFALLLLAGSGWLRAADKISVRNQDGRKIFVNDSAPTTNNSASGSSSQLAARNSVRLRMRYVYWSNTQHRWKAVPASGVNAARARSAAAEVLSETGESESGLSPGHTAATDANASIFVSTEKVNAAIEQAANRHNVDANLVRALIKVESNFNPHAVSRTGAMGLMQIMPGTARSLNLAHPFDPNENVDAGVRHLKQLLENFGGNVGLSLAAYNAGAGAVQRSHGIPPYAETRNYVKQITALYGSGFNLMGGPKRVPVQVSHDAEGHLVFSNIE